MAKTGRKRKIYTTSDGQTVNGLGKKSDGRWACLDCGKRWTQSDEYLAVRDFHAHRRQAHGADQTISIPSVARKADDLNQLGRSMVTGGILTLTATPDAGDDALGASGDKLRPTAASVEHLIPADVLWQWLRDKLIHNPDEIAQRTGIEAVRRLADLPKPKPSPSIASIGKLYHERKIFSPQEGRESPIYWGDLLSAMDKIGVTTARQLTPAHINDWGDAVLARGKSAVYANHRFSKVKAVFNFARKRGVEPLADVSNAIAATAVLVKQKRSAPTPMPIERLDLHKMLASADETMRAAILMGLNLSLAPKEITAVAWDELELSKRHFVSSRNKTGIIRIGVLWGRTIDALGKLDQTSSHVLMSNRGTALSVWTLRDRWNKLRKSAGVKASLDSLKDGAQTAAIGGGATLIQADLLAGHSLGGVKDHYAQRRPQMVETACRAIEDYYF